MSVAQGLLSFEMFIFYFQSTGLLWKNSGFADTVTNGLVRDIDTPDFVSLHPGDSCATGRGTIATTGLYQVSYDETKNADQLWRTARDSSGLSGLSSAASAVGSRNHSRLQ